MPGESWRQFQSAKRILTPSNKKLRCQRVLNRLFQSAKRILTPSNNSATSLKRVSLLVSIRQADPHAFEHR